MQTITQWVQGVWAYCIDHLAVLNMETINVWGLTLGALALAGLLGLVALGFLAVRAPGRVSKFAGVLLVLVTTGLFLVAIILQQSWAMDLTPGVQRLMAPNGVLVRGYIIDAPDYIYLTLDVRGTPRLYRIPWTEQTEKKFAEKEEEAGKNGAKSGKDEMQGLRLRFMPSDEDREVPDLFFQPWPAPPVKSTEAPVPIEVE